jgi:toxin ParE1/3/4
MAKYQLTNKAVNDISEIWNFTADNWSEIQADTYYNLLLNTCQDLADGKITGKNYPEIDSAISGYRAGQHILFYQSLSDKEILIVRILHVQMDLKNRITD